MLKINSLKLLLLRNDENFQYHTECKALIEKDNALVLKIKPLFDQYLSSYAAQDEAMLVIRKSSISQEIVDADMRRDNDFRGFAEAVKAAQKHFNSQVVVAANKVRILLDTTGNVVPLPYAQETSKIYNLLQELQTKYSEDIKLLRLEDWVLRLQESNQQFERLTRQRVEEVSQRTLLKVKETRQATDNAHKAIMTHIEAYLILGEEAIFQSFIPQLNAINESYRNLLAQRQGRSEAKKNTSTNTPE